LEGRRFTAVSLEEEEGRTRHLRIPGYKIAAWFLNTLDITNESILKLILIEITKQCLSYDDISDQLENGIAWALTRQSD
jgi:hypothetical protein